MRGVRQILGAFMNQHLALLLPFPITTDPELTIDGRRATRGGDDQALRLRLGCSDQRPLSPVGRTCLKLIKADIRARLVPIPDEDQISPTSTAFRFSKNGKNDLSLHRNRRLPLTREGKLCSYQNYSSDSSSSFRSFYVSAALGRNWRPIVGG